MSKLERSVVEDKLTQVFRNWGYSPIKSQSLSAVLSETVMEMLNTSYKEGFIEGHKEARELDF